MQRLAITSMLKHWEPYTLIFLENVGRDLSLFLTVFEPSEKESVLCIYVGPFMCIETFLMELLLNK